MQASNETAPFFKMPRLFQGIRHIEPSQWPQEILAGVTLAALAIPLNIGYAQVAGLPPIVGLYAAIAPLIVFPLLCTSRHLVASPDAPIAALIGSVLMGMAATGDPEYVQLAYAQALLCALIFLIFWIFRLGFLANFLSRAVLIGFISGLGIEVFTSQMKKIMGVTVEAEGYFRELWALITSIPLVNIYTLIIGVGTIVMIRLLKRYTPRVPGALLALVVMTVLVAVFQLDARGVSVLGEVPSGLPRLTIPQVAWVDYLRLFPGAIAICGVTMAEGLLVARQYAQKYGEKLDADQEMFAFGGANVVSALTGGFAVGSSASRTAAMDSMGARSQIPSLVAGIVVAVVLLFFANLLALLPNAALGGIVANAVLSLIEVGELQKLYHMRRSEFAVAAVCLLSVLVLGALPAVIIAFLLSTIDVVRRAAAPKTGVLVESPARSGYAIMPSAPAEVTRPGLIIYRFGSALYFANATLFEEEVKQFVERADPPPTWFVLDAEAVSDIDTTGAEALEEVAKFLHQRNITFAITRANPPIPGLLERYALLDVIGNQHLYATNRDAADAFEEATSTLRRKYHGRSLSTG